MPGSGGSRRSFTLLELIIVIIIIGVLATLGFMQYSFMLEKARTTEAVTAIGLMRQLTDAYYLRNNQSLSGMRDADVGATNTCTGSNFFSYSTDRSGSSTVDLMATRCTSGGKQPDAERGYVYLLQYTPASAIYKWMCVYEDDGSACFGQPSS